MPSYYVHILTNKSGALYVGVSNTLVDTNFGQMLRPGGPDSLRVRFELANAG